MESFFIDQWKTITTLQENNRKTTSQMEGETGAIAPFLLEKRLIREMLHKDLIQTAYGLGLEEALL
jgi:hypothetical protein